MAKLKKNQYPQQVLVEACARGQITLGTPDTIQAARQLESDGLVKIEVVNTRKLDERVRVIATHKGHVVLGQGGV